MPSKSQIALVAQGKWSVRKLPPFSLSNVPAQHRLARQLGIREDASGACLSRKGLADQACMHRRLERTSCTLPC